MQMVDHPEYNSTLILRSENITDVQNPSSFPAIIPRLLSDSNGALMPTRSVHRRLLPRRPGRDEPVEQQCTLYALKESKPSVLVLTPIVNPGTDLPYYHPAVDHLALRYIPRLLVVHTEQRAAASPATQTEYGDIEILVVPHEPTLAHDPSSRLHRTCRALLETLHRYGWGTLTSYQKRVQHDRLVPREIYQDLYLVMRERHKKLVNTWVEGTDPLKHVFEVKKGSLVGPIPPLSPVHFAENPSGHRHRNFPHALVERHVRRKFRSKQSCSGGLSD
jgi:tRNASer (uridine44-2'-O)-methyltransferase